MVPRKYQKKKKILRLCLVSENGRKRKKKLLKTINFPSLDDTGKCDGKNIKKNMDEKNVEDMQKKQKKATTIFYDKKPYSSQPHKTH